jgi:hypothetical protein
MKQNILPTLPNGTATLHNLKHCPIIILVYQNPAIKILYLHYLKLSVFTRFLKTVLFVFYFILYITAFIIPDVPNE